MNNIDAWASVQAMSSVFHVYHKPWQLKTCNISNCHFWLYVNKTFFAFWHNILRKKNIFKGSYASNLLNYIQVNQQMIKKTNCQTTLLTIVIYEFGICLIRNTEWCVIIRMLRMNAKLIEVCTLLLLRLEKGYRWL